MVIKYPDSYKEVAIEIASSWKLNANYVLVSPPLNFPERVFKLLCDISFQEECKLEPEQLAIASMSPSNCKISSDFVKHVMKEWKVDIDDECLDDKEKLEQAIRILNNENRTPIILIPQFHETMERLSWTFGQQLRELQDDHDNGLLTVVELPISLERLKERWKMIEGKKNFYCSSFGQGHLDIVLTGYSEKEVKNILKDFNISEDYLEKIMMWSGGIPVLVQWLVHEAFRARSIESLDIRARQGSIEKCERFLKWLDTPGVDYFKKLISNLWLKKGKEEDRINIKEHIWKDTLVNRNGDVLSHSIGIACNTSLGNDYADKLKSISKSIRNREFSEVNALVNSLPIVCRTEKRIKHILVLISVWELTIGFSPDWRKIEEVTKNLEKKLGESNNNSSKPLAAKLMYWHNFAKGINSYNRMKERDIDENSRLSDYLSGRGGNNNIFAAIQLVLYMLNESNRTIDKSVALKMVLPIPEQVLQIYCGRKLKISIWDAPEFDKNVIDSVEKLWEKGEYQVPRKNSRLSFIDLLYFGWVQMKKLDIEDRLFDQFSDISYWCETYENIRNEPSHSIVLESEKNWDEFYRRCIKLSDRLSIALTGKSSSELLPNLDEDIISLEKEEEQKYDNL